MSFRPLTETAIDEIVDRLGFDGRPAADLGGLHAVYSAWCRRVPFDNLRKLVALHFGMPELPGIHPDDFFAAWLLTGAGGTCWGSNNALHALLVGLEFDAALHAASMFDAEINHGTTIVTIDGERWLVDTALHGDVPAPIRDEPTSVEHAGFVTSVRPDERGWVFECPTPDPAVRVPCRILGPMTHEFTLEAYERSRMSSPFNEGLMVGVNDATGVWMLKHNTLVRIESSGVTSTECTDADVDSWMADVAGHSPQLVAEVRAILDFQRESAGS